MIKKMLILMALFMLMAVPVRASDITNCDTLADNDIYMLSSDIINNDSSICFTIGSNLILDCQNHIIDGDSINGAIGIFIGGSDNTIENCLISDYITSSIDMDGNNNTVINSQLINSSQSVFVHDNVYNDSFINCQFVNNSYSGMSIESGTSISVRDSSFLDNGINIYDSSHDNSFNNNTFNSSSYAYCDGCHDDDFNGNLWSDMNNTGYSDRCKDCNNDGVCDAPFFVMAGITDNAPKTYNHFCVNYTELDLNHTSYKRCIVDNTYQIEFSNYDGVWHNHSSSEWCENGCDSTTNTCNPNINNQGLIVLAYFIGFIGVAVFLMKIFKVF